MRTVEKQRQKNPGVDQTGGGGAWVVKRSGPHSRKTITIIIFLHTRVQSLPQSLLH